MSTVYGWDHSLAVPECQVRMDDAVVNQVFHATGNLIGKAHFVLKCDRLRKNKNDNHNLEDDNHLYVHRIVD